jgi:hypothetical protein
MRRPATDWSTVLDVCGSDGSEVCMTTASITRLSRSGP